MRLRDILAGSEGIQRLQENIDLDMEFGSVKSDSRRIEAGDIFIAIKGDKTDGHNYIAQALQRGAGAIIIEDEAFCEADTPWILVKGSRELHGIMQQNLAGRPSLEMNVIGVTGTNGKTTVTHMLAAIMEEAGKMTGLLGTIHNRIGDRILPADLTTPGSEELADMLRLMADLGTDYAIMEASSHALDQSRTAGIEFDLAIFTNLSQDHMDYHETPSAYLAAKTKLFSGIKPLGEKRRKKAVILNMDDESSATIADFCRVPVITYGLSELCHVQAKDIEFSTEGIRYLLVYGGYTHEIRMNLYGRFNVYNSLAAIAAALVEGVDTQVIRKAFEKMAPVPGRFQQVADTGNKLPFHVYIDYSHTPDGLDKCITTARELCRGRIICVFGAGGNRDRTKRPLMGEIAARLSDLCVITSDNPRDEDPLAIIADVLQGAERPGAKAETLTEPDRKKAITLAITMAQPGDIVLICGKGHEDYQIIGDTKHTFDDYVEAQKAMESL